MKTISLMFGISEGSERLDHTGGTISSKLME